MKKRLLALLLSVLMLASVFPVTAMADDSGHTHQRQLVEIETSLLSPSKYLGKFYCEECGETYYSQILPEDVGMPIIDLGGSLLTVTKANPEDLSFSYSSQELSFDSIATLKMQGNTSLWFPKKNYNVKLIKEDGSKDKVKLVDEWGKQSKYCLKANYVDYSQARNIVSARLFNQIVHSRNINDELNALPNGGVIDGFPVLVYNNGKFLGLYTMNIPKDKWMFGMNNENLYQAIMLGDDWTSYARLTAEIPGVDNIENYGWDIEYCSTEDDPEVGCGWAVESMNNFINFLINNDGENFKRGIGQYTDLDRAIDAMLYTFFTYASDNTAKNIAWVTYDGVKWIPSMYDMDATWGMNYSGEFNHSPNGFAPGGNNLLYKRLLDNYINEIRERYVELRQSVLSESNIQKEFSAFISTIPDVVYAADAEKWITVPSKDENNLEQIVSFAHERAAFLDAWFGVTITENEQYAYRADFEAPAGTDILVYPSQDYSALPTSASYAYSVTKTGELTKQDGQVNFRVEPPEGYEVDSISVSPEGSYANIKGPADTGEDNTYRITKISSNIKVTVNLKESEVQPEAKGYKVDFVCNGEAEIYVYPKQDYSLTPELTTSTVSVDSDTGEPTQSGDGQVNFTVVPAEGYTVASVSVSPKSYKNIKGPEDTGADNTYRITKITGDITVTVTLESTAPADQGFNVDFATDGHASVLVYPGQDYNVQPVECTQTVCIDPDTGLPAANGKGQVNFTVVPENGYELVSVTVAPDNYKNIKGPEDTGADNTYRITKITGDLTVSITTKKLPVEPAAPKLTVNASALTINKGEYAAFRAIVTDMPEGAQVKWTVSGSKLYKVDSDGLTLAVYSDSVGQISVTSQLVLADGSTAASDSKTVTVEESNFLSKLGSWAVRKIVSINFVQIIRDLVNSRFWEYL